MSLSTNSDATNEDLTAINEVVATIQRTQRSESVSEFLGVFDERAIWTTGGGVRLVGLPEIRAFTEGVYCRVR